MTLMTTERYMSHTNIRAKHETAAHEMLYWVLDLPLS